MYSKIVAFAILSFLITGCSFFSEPEPKKQNLKDVKVIEKIDNNTTTETNSTITTIKKAPVKVSSKTSPALKPEPFSLKSNEQDPELLGPQTTLKGSLLKKEIENEEKPQKENKKLTKSAKNSTKKDEKKETL